MTSPAILVFDDERRTLEALTAALDKAGYAPISVTESDDPVAQFSAMTPELVFLSLHANTVMKVCEQIRSTGEGVIVPIIFVGSGHSEVRSPSEALAHGGDYYFDEPLDLPTILAKVQTYVGAPTGAPSQKAENQGARAAGPIAKPEPPTKTTEVERSPRPPFKAPVQAEGDFGPAADIADLLAALPRQHVTGRVDFTSGTRQKSLVLERGHPVDAYSSQVFDRMDEYLLREGRITRQHYNEVRVKGLRGPRRIGAYLTSVGYLRPDELFSAVRGHLEELVYSLFEWEEGTYGYVQEHVDDDDRVMLDRDPRALIVEGIRRKYLLQRTLQKLGGPSSLLVRTDPEGHVDYEVLGLSTDERRVARLVDGTRNIEDIVFSSGLAALRVYHVLTALVATGAAKVAVRGIDGVNTNGELDIDDIDRERILERVHAARQADYFQILGLPRSATTYEVDLAFDRIRRELAPGSLSPSVRASLIHEIDEIERVLEDARDVLRDPRMRAAYAKHLPGQ